jgi:hypothetical protein
MSSFVGCFYFIEEGKAHAAIGIRATGIMSFAPSIHLVIILQLMGINIISSVHCANLALVQRTLLVLLIPYTMSLDILIHGSTFAIANEFTLLETVESIFLLISLVEGNVEANTTNHGNDGNRAIVPHEKRVLRQADKGLTKRSGDSGGREGNGLDSGFHVVGCLGVSVPADVSIAVFQGV